MWRSDRSTAVSLIVLAGVAAALLLVAFPYDFLLGTARFWTEPTADLTQHMSGAAYFARAPWGLPLFQVPDLGYPAGTNIVFTDSIPLVAVITKLIHRIGGTYWHGFGVWFAVCAVLQPVAFAVLLRACGERRAAVLIPGGLLALFTPFLLVRFGHLALCGQWLLLLSLAVHAHTQRHGFGACAVAGHGGLVLLALFIHPYLFVFALCAVLMTAVQGLWSGSLSPAGAAGRVAAIVAPLPPVMLLTGHLGEPMRPKPFGEYALNLLAPVLPQHSGLFPDLPDLGVAGLETMVWVGAGALLVMAAALWSIRREVRGLAGRHGGDLIACGVLLLFSCAYTVQVGPWTLLGISPAIVRETMLAVFRDGASPAALASHLTIGDALRLAGLALLWSVAAGTVLYAASRPGRRGLLVVLAVAGAVALGAVAVAPMKVAVFISNFQASARFAWIVLYWGLAAAIVALARRWPTPRLAALLVAALVLQVLDTAPLTADLRAIAGGPVSEMIADGGRIAESMARAGRVELVPTYVCAFIELPEGAARDDTVRVVRSLHVLASRSAVPINSAQNSRATAAYRYADTPDCDGQRRAAVSSPPPQGTLRVFAIAAWSDPRPIDAFLAGNPQCQRLGETLLCR